MVVWSKFCVADALAVTVALRFKEKWLTKDAHSVDDDANDCVITKKRIK